MDKILYNFPMKRHLCIRLRKVFFSHNIKKEKKVLDSTTFFFCIYKHTICINKHEIWIMRSVFYINFTQNLNIKAHFLIMNNIFISILACCIINKNAWFIERQMLSLLGAGVAARRC